MKILALSDIHGDKHLVKEMAEKAALQRENESLKQQLSEAKEDKKKTEKDKEKAEKKC